MVVFCRQIFAAVHMQLARTKKDTKVWIVLILTVILLIRYLADLTRCGIENNTVITPFVMPLVFADASVSNGLIKILICLAIVCLFSEAPFWEVWGRNAIVRCSRIAWWGSVCIYIWIMSAAYVLFLFIVSSLIVLPTASLSDMWGSTLRMIISRNVYLKTNLVIPSAVIQQILPEAAQLLTMLVSWLSFVLIGHTICFFNVLTNKKSIGITAAVIMIMADPIVTYLARGVRSLYYLYRFSPINWSSIDNWTILGFNRPISMQYAVEMYLILIVIQMMVIIMAGKRKEI